MTAPRTFSYRALRLVLEAGQMTDEALKESRLSELATRDRAFVRALLMAVLRDYGRLEKILRPMLKDPNKMPPEVWAMLLLGTAQLLVLKTPPHAAVNETIELAVRENMGGFKGLLNAVLRRVDRDGRKLFEQTSVTQNFPSWLLKSWEVYPDRDAWLPILTTEPALDITAPKNIDDIALKLNAEKISAQTLRLQNAGEVTRLEGYTDGAWWVQDVAAAQPVQMLGDITGKTVLDLCAAPGGKTMQLIAGGAQVIAVDSSAQRLGKLQENLSRTKMQADVQCADVLNFTPALKQQSGSADNNALKQQSGSAEYDIIVLDAPCTATGTIRRHPEILIHKRQNDTQRLAALQSQMLTRAKDWVKPGGQLLYCTCSLQPEEGEAQIEKFLATNSEFKLSEQKRILPNQFPGGNDGFFMALLNKAA